MNRKISRAALIALLLLMALMLCSCGKNNAPANTAEPAPAAAEEKLSDEQLLDAIKNYCYKSNPDLKDIVEAGEYTVYWEITSSSENEAVVLYRSYTGAEIRYYINRTTGETYVTELVPGVIDEEQKTDESFNVKDYLA